MTRLFLTLALLAAGPAMLSGCGDSYNQSQWDRFGEASEQNGYWCAKAYPDYSNQQCLDLYNTTRFQKK